MQASGGCRRPDIRASAKGPREDSAAHGASVSRAGHRGCVLPGLPSQRRGGEWRTTTARRSGMVRGPRRARRPSAALGLSAGPAPRGTSAPSDRTSWTAAAIAALPGRRFVLRRRRICASGESISAEGSERRLRDDGASADETEVQMRSSSVGRFWPFMEGMGEESADRDETDGALMGSAGRHHSGRSLRTEGCGRSLRTEGSIGQNWPVLSQNLHPSWPEFRYQCRGAKTAEMGPRSKNVGSSASTFGSVFAEIGPQWAE